MESMRIYGYCKKCGGPLFLHVDPDVHVYKVRSLRCWNGHYQEITNIHCADMPDFNKSQADKKVINITELLQKNLKKKYSFAY